MQYNNLGACMCWLRMMYDRSGGPGFFGDNPEAVADMVKIYDIGYPFLYFFAEVPFIGNPGVDISVQYRPDWFKQDNILQGRKSSSEGDFFHQYAKLIDKSEIKLLEDLNCFLEADTSKMTKFDRKTASNDTINSVAEKNEDCYSKFAVFINNGEETFKPFMNDILAWQNSAQRQPAIQGIFDKVSNKVRLWNFGFMNSRQGRPVRLDFRGKNDGDDSNTRDLADLLDGAEALGLKAFIDSARPTLELIDSLNIFGNYVLDIEVFEDGSVGNRIGFEMQPPAPYPTLQRSVLRSLQFKKFMEHLIGLGMADERIYELQNCLFSIPFSDDRLAMFHVYSYISHFKLVWIDGQPKLGKIYLEMRTVNRQYNINESLNKAIVY